MVVRRGQDHLRRRVADLAPAVGARGIWNFELPQDIVEDRGYPQLTEQAKRKILGENLARLHGVDIEAKKAELGV